MIDLLGAISRHVVQPAVMLKHHSRELTYAREYQRTQFLSPEQLQAYQLARLRAILRYAWERSAYYARIFRAAGLADPAEINTLDALAQLPLLTKAHLREYYDELLVSDPASHPLLEKKTSGSTGIPLRMVWSEAARQHKAALTARHNAWAGHRLGDAVGLVWGDYAAPTSLRSRVRAALLERVTVLDSQRLNEASMARFTEEVRRRRIRTLLGHAQPLCHYARYLTDTGASDLPVRSVIPTAMVLHAGQRRLLEQAFGAEVFERYGSEETSVIASECPVHQGMHLAAEGLLVEVITEHGPAAPGETGEIVITDVTNFALPLIRYRIGDMGVRGAETCPCGRSLPVLARVYGRVADNILTPDGRVVSGISITDHLVEVDGIRQVQLVQTAREELVFRIVRDARFTERSEARLREHCARIFGEGMRIRCEFVIAIPTGPHGKYRLCLSHFTQEPISAAVGEDA